MSEELVGDLKAQIAKGNAVLITGTGVSIAACGNPAIDGHNTVPGILMQSLAQRERKWSNFYSLFPPRSDPAAA